MPDKTVQPETGGKHRRPDPEQTDRYPEVQAIVDAFVAPAEQDQNGGE